MRIYRYLLVILLLATPCYADVIQKNDDGTFAVTQADLTIDQLKTNVNIYQTKVNQDQAALDTDQALLDKAQTDLGVATEVDKGSTLDDAKRKVKPAPLPLPEPIIDETPYGN